jgi:hypothetical protein
MRYRELFEDVSSKIVAHLSDRERHDLLQFIYYWLVGNYMHTGEPQKVNALAEWKKIAALFPPKVKSEQTLFRLITVPVKYADQTTFEVKPAPGPVSSWTNRLIALDSVAGIANETFTSNDYETARLAISATIPGNLILATPQSIKQAFFTLSHDYWDRYKEQTEEIPLPGGRKEVRTTHPGYPGGEDPSRSDFSMWDYGYMYSIMKEFRGGHLKQYEYVAVTPNRVTATVLRKYRVGDTILRYGIDDPHN